jgi:chromosome partitioning protein
MTKTIAFSNQKGGVGKTTSVANVGAALARRGFRVLLVDLDPQANLTRGLGVANPEHTIYGALLQEYSLKAYPLGERLALVACSPAFSSFERVKGDEIDKEYLLKELLAPVLPRFDYVLLDCPPSLGLITVNAFACAGVVLVPLEAQFYAVDGLDKVIETVGKVNRRINPSLRVGGVFFTRYDKRRVLNRDTAESVRERLPGAVMQATIRENIALGEAPTQGQDIFAYAPDSNGAKDYDALTGELLTMLQ